MKLALRQLAPLLALLALSAAAPPLAAQETAGADELAELERLAEESFAADELEAAIGYYRQLVERLDESAERSRVRMYVASIEHLLGRRARAVQTLEELLLEDPGYRFRAEVYGEEFRGLFYEAQKRVIEERERRAAQNTRAGTEALRRDDLAAARRSFSEALRYRPEHPPAIYNLALVDLRDGRVDAAEAGFQRLLVLDEGPTGPLSSTLRTRALVNLGFLYTNREQHQEAEEVLSRAVALDGADPSAWLNLGVTRRRLGNREGAAEAFRRAYELAPEDPDVVEHLALAYLDAEDWVRAASLLREATARDPENAGLWLKLGLAQLRLGDGAAAAVALENAARRDPTNSAGVASSAAVNLAVHHYGAGEHGQALEQAERALAWDPEEINGWIYKGLAEQELGDLQAALQSLERARLLDPERAETQNNLGSVYYRLGRFAEAREAFERALALDPQLADARKNLAALEKAGNRPPPPPPPPTRRRRGDPPPTAPAPAPRLGLRFADTDYSALGLKGVLVAEVEARSPAGRAGIRRNDLVLEIDDREIASPGDVETYLRELRRGQTVVVELLRDNVPRKIVVRLE